MTKLTQKQEAFVQNKIAGLPHRDAAIHAGYAVASAEQTATKLMKHPAVKAALKKRKNGVVALQRSLAKRQDWDGDGIGEKASLPKRVMPRKRYDDPMQFLEDTMNHEDLPHAVRMDASKTLMPYKHARIGEKGKKEQRKERAQEIASGGSSKRGRFQPKTAPNLTLLRGGVG